MLVLFVGNFLSQRGLTPTASEELVPRLREAGWTIVTTSSKRARVARVLDMQSHIWVRSYDIAQIDVYSGNAFRWAELSAWNLERHDTPYVLTLHGGRLPEMLATPASSKRVRRLLIGAQAVVAPSEYLREAFLTLRSDIDVIPNGLDLANYASPEDSALPERPALLWLRAFHEVYRPDLAIQTLARLVEDDVNVSLRMIGPDKKDGSLEAARRQIVELGLEERVEIVGGIPKDQVPSELQRGSLFLNTSDVDNTPVSVIEAMASGLPVVSTDAGGIGHLVRDGEDGLVVPRGDANALAAAVRRLLHEESLANRLGAEARRKVAAFDWSEVVPRWDALLRHCIEGHALKGMH